MPERTMENGQYVYRFEPWEFAKLFVNGVFVLDFEKVVPAKEILMACFPDEVEKFESSLKEKDVAVTKINRG